jgi:hypothetical protein
MPNVNTPESGHVVSRKFTRYQFLPFTNAHFLAVLRDAMRVITGRVTGHEPCNAAFRALPGRRSFADLWADPTVWINFDPQMTPGIFGAKIMGYPPEITITATTLTKGRWWTAATLVHEFAHVNGAPGAHSGDHARDAEEVLRRCLLKDLADPTIIGAVSRPTGLSIV